MVLLFLEMTMIIVVGRDYSPAAFVAFVSDPSVYIMQLILFLVI